MSLCSPEEHWSAGNLSHPNSAESSDVVLGGFPPGQCGKAAWDKSAIGTSLKCSLFFVMETALYFPKSSWNLLWFLKGHRHFTEPSLESSEQGLASPPKATCVIDRPCAEAKSSYDQSPCALLTQRWLQLLRETQDSFGELILGTINMSMPSSWHLSGGPFLCPRVSFSQRRKHLGDLASLSCEF